MEKNNSLKRQLAKQITNNWYHRLTGLQRLFTNPFQEKVQTNTSFDQDNIVIKKQQLIEFTKKFAIQKIEYQEKISSLSYHQKQLTETIKKITEQNEQLKQDNRRLQQYMVKLKENHQAQIKEFTKTKDTGLDHYQLMNYRIRQLEQSLTYQRTQNIRYQEFLKIKEQIIKNLQWDKTKNSQRILQPVIPPNERNTPSYQKPKTKSIILKKAKNINGKAERQISSTLQSDKDKDKEINTEIKKIILQKKLIEKDLNEIWNQNCELKGKIQILQIDLEYSKNQLRLQKTKTSPNKSNDIKKIQSILQIKDELIQSLRNQNKRLSQKILSSKINTSPSYSKNKNYYQIPEVKILKQKCSILQSQVQLLQKKLLQSHHEIYFQPNTTLSHRKNSLLSSSEKVNRTLILEDARDLFDKSCSRQQDAKSIGRMLAGVTKFS